MLYIYIYICLPGGARGAPGVALELRGLRRGAGPVRALHRQGHGAQVLPVRGAGRRVHCHDPDQRGEGSNDNDNTATNE